MSEPQSPEVSQYTYVILLDISLPGTYGTSVVKSLKQTVQCAEIVFVSEHEPNVLKEMAAIAEVRHWIAKSQLGNELIAKLEAIEEARKPRSR